MFMLTADDINHNERTKRYQKLMYSQINEIYYAKTLISCPLDNLVDLQLFSD